MGISFKNRIRAALANPELQAALDANAEKRVNGRRQAFASLPDYRSQRRRAHAVRADVIANLDSYIDQFVERAQANGVHVHHAAHAAEAVQIVLEIAGENRAKLIAKSKTMVSEEIHLNRALEQAGLEVVETDLGEFIVQLRGEPPAHIITPAVHLRRHEVGQTFHEKLSLPLTDDIPEMTSAARTVLRQVFLNADIGLSGVNFGVAETGTLCILTNEGNGRMVTTLPRVHIALMGIERLVPNMADLEIMLSLLPRSATGQKLTVYANLINGPRHPGDADGPEQRHVILVDNGRRALRETPLAEILYCIRCGACLNACPVFRKIGGHAYVGATGKGSAYPGPLGSVLSPALFGQAEFAQLARASSLCGACKEACPVDIDLPRLLLRVRAGKVSPVGETNPPGRHEAPQSVPWFLNVGLKAFTWVAGGPRRYALALKLAGLGARLLPARQNWLRLPALTGWGYSKDFPRPAVTPFRERAARRAPDGQPGETPTPRGAPPREGIPPPVPELRAESARTGAARFTAELQDLGGRVVWCNAAEAPDLIVRLLEEHGIDAIYAGEGEHLPVGLLERIEQKKIAVKHDPDPELRAGLTGAFAAAADTGSIVVASGAGRPLSASLLPEIHMAVLYEQDIYPSLASLWAGNNRQKDDRPPRLSEFVEPAACVIVSGPSRTADIEMTLTIGVHGPKEIHVFCIRDASGA